MTRSVGRLAEDAETAEVPEEEYGGPAGWDASGI
jgi:hypothetical protein